ncbi:TetR/AcrR family transcriptional regulator [Pectobacterium sp. PL64]|uniref:TetR/AcrR family transcriptional regulator n=1 Tax=Pectobacterium sp. PL64 TaxID=2738983 RepID=UPI001F0C08B3|nr:TetR/AcrR family transcriptional regulator [Pectobacterium sp. PL64]UMO89950.1 TetR/AcrR family transcriptional regulator [Pectobacterium sp. PL64]
MVSEKIDKTGLSKRIDDLDEEEGYSSFSYADFATKIGISKASIHHHFPSKEMLGEEVMGQSPTDVGSWS